MVEPPAHTPRKAWLSDSLEVELSEGMCSVDRFEFADQPIGQFLCDDRHQPPHPVHLIIRYIFRFVIVGQTNRVVV